MQRGRQTGYGYTGGALIGGKVRYLSGNPPPKMTLGGAKSRPVVSKKYLAWQEDEERIEDFEKEAASGGKDSLRASYAAQLGRAIHNAGGRLPQAVSLDEEIKREAMSKARVGFIRNAAAQNGFPINSLDTWRQAASMYGPMFKQVKADALAGDPQAKAILDDALIYGINHDLKEKGTVPKKPYLGSNPLNTPRNFPYQLSTGVVVNPGKMEDI